MGRWLSPDWSANAEPVPYATLGDPQSLNLYQYVRNNPLKNSDADGHECPPDCMGGFLLSKDDAACDCGGGSDGPAGKIFLEASAAIMAGPEVGALAAEATTIGQGLAAGAAALGVTGTAVNAVTDTVGAATHTNVDEATNAVTALTNPVAAGVSLATGSTEKGSQAADFATVAKAGAGLAQGKVPSNPADVANSLKGAKEAVAGVVDKAKSSISGALAPAPSAPSAPPAPRPPACGSTPGAC